MKRSRVSKIQPHFLYGAGVIVIAGAAVFAAPALFSVSYDAVAQQEASMTTPVVESVSEGPVAAHLPTPEPMYAIYMSQCVVGTPSFRDSLVSFIDDSKLNAVVIDIKDYSGTIGFPAKDVRFKDAAMKTCGAADMRDFIQMLHEKHIYVIGRITVFQDPTYTKAHPDQAVQSKSRPGQPWKDHKGLSFIDVSSKPFWDYIVTLSKESYAIGFDELNFDYIRYPSDGPMADAVYQNSNKPVALENFWSYLHQQVKPTGVMMSADLFGMTTTNTDDLNIGQVLERALPYFDYIAPMVYPSHYPTGFHNLGNPNLHPYEIVNFAMAEAAHRAAATSTTVAAFTHTAIASTSPQLYSKPSYSPLKLRPWLQDFNYGGTYDAAAIRAQIKANEDAGLTSWFFWDPANKYKSLRQVLAQ